MILSCPSCAKRFLLDAGLLGAGRKVKCGACSHIWFQEPPKPERQPTPAGPGADTLSRSAQPAVGSDLDFDHGPPANRFQSFLDELEEGAASSTPVGEPDPPSRLRRPVAEEPPPGPSRWKSTLPWAGLAASVALVCVGLFTSRDVIVAAWPAANGLYELAGIPVEPFDAGLDAVHIAEFREVEGNPMLFVTGEVRNTSDREREVPDLVATALDPQGKPVQSWLITPTARRLPPRQSASFSSVQPEGQSPAKEIAIAFQPPPR